MRPEKGRSDDGISELFGEVVAPEAPIQYATRREMREALAAQAAGRPVAPVAAAPVAVSAPAPAPAKPVADVATDPIAAIIAPAAAAPVLPAPVAAPVHITASIPVIPASPAAAPAAAWAQLTEAASARSAGDAPVAGPSRRELRGARSAQGVASVTARPVVARTAPSARPATIAKPHHVPKKRASALVTMVAVAGLFATAALPAYALSSTTTENPASAKALSSDVTALKVNNLTEAAATKRGDFTATSTDDIASQMSNAQKAANYEAYMKSGARELGDDYPYFSELSNNQGGGLSPLNYYYRECVDFVAWRLNRDAGSVEAPFKWDWSYLTPAGGNAYQWKANWQAHGWKISNTPKAGSVAWFGYHVGYVKSVNKDGTVTIEEYNHNSDHIYGQRTIPATDVTSYLYAPPQ